MKQNKKWAWISLGIFVLLAVVIFKDFVFFGKVPFPGNYMQAWFEPWRSLHFVDGQIRLPHKPVVDDAFRHILPFRLLSIETMKNFQIPLWNPYNGAGQPLLATLNSGFFDPFNAIYAFFPLGIAHGVFVMLHFVFAGFAMYWYVRTLKLHPVSGIFAGVVYVLSGFVIIRLIFTNYGTALVALPFMLAAIEYGAAKRASSILFAVPMLLAITIVSTQPQITVYILGITGLYGVVRLWRQWRRLGLFVALYVLGIALTSIQLLPTIELMRYAHIHPGDSMDIVRKYLMPVEFLRSIPIPNFYGNTATYNYWGGRSDSVQTASYVGILPVLLAFFSLRCIKKYRATIVFFVLAAIVSMALAVDWPGSAWFYSQPIPILSTGAPSRFFMVTTMALTVLAAFGFDTLYAQKKLSKWFVFLAILTAGAVLLLLKHTHALHVAMERCPLYTPQTCRITAYRNTLLAIMVFAPQLGLAIVLPWLKRKKQTLFQIAIFLMVSSVVASGVYNAYKALPHSPSLDLFPNQPVIERLQSHTQDARVFGLGEAQIVANLATQFRIYDPQFYHPLYIYRYRELLEYATNNRYILQFPRGDASIRDYLRDNPKLLARRERLLNLTSTKYRLYKKEELAGDVPGGVFAWDDDTWLLVASESALPRAYLASAMKIESSPAGILAALYNPDFDYRNTVIVEEPIPQSKDVDPVSGIATVTRYEADRVDISVRASRQAMLVLTDNYYPGWHAFIDGEPASLYRANYVFRAVAVPAGEHTVTFRYRPASVRYGMAISFVSACVLFVLFRMRKSLLS